MPRLPNQAGSYQDDTTDINRVFYVMMKESKYDW